MAWVPYPLCLSLSLSVCLSFSCSLSLSLSLSPSVCLSLCLSQYNRSLCCPPGQTLQFRLGQTIAVGELGLVGGACGGLGTLAFTATPEQCWLVYKRPQTSASTERIYRAAGASTRCASCCLPGMWAHSSLTAAPAAAGLGKFQGGGFGGHCRAKWR